jgi:DNA-binding response OmpR family regulator
MPKTKILLVDNDLDFLETRREFLEREGYSVITAFSPLAAKEQLEQENADLAIIDIRLLNDDDEKDISGIELAKYASCSIPVVILTGFPSAAYMRQTLGPQFDGTQIAYDFLTKEDGPIALMSSIRRTLEISRKSDPDTLEARVHLILRKNLKEFLTNQKKGERKPIRGIVPINLNVPEQMLKDYELARLHARWIGWVRLGLVIGGILVFLFGVVMVILGYGDVGIIGVITGAITGTVGGLITKVANDANRRWEQFHKELILLYKDTRKKKKGST